MQAPSSVCLRLDQAECPPPPPGTARVTAQLSSKRPVWGSAWADSFGGGNPWCWSWTTSTVSRPPGWWAASACFPNGSSAGVSFSLGEQSPRAQGPSCRMLLCKHSSDNQDGQTLGSPCGALLARRQGHRLFSTAPRTLFPSLSCSSVGTSSGSTNLGLFYFSASQAGPPITAQTS